ncbi:non-structural maintenance of chromosomes element 4 homolog A-like [Primulina huaijiensis]|uniref:non-structural maintenance of chromosomes element 4 homolog A-like n=1 Tax=Primulina huaijiensis TaxID=1492673 RepID=UPI003CC7269E
MVRTLKKEPISNGGRLTRSSAQNINGEGCTTNNGGPEDTTVERRVLRSKYLRFKNRISDERDDMSKVDADKFKLMIDEVDSLHQLVQKPREQVADAEALFDITNTFVSSVKAYRNEGRTPSDFVSCLLLRDLGQQGVASSQEYDGRNLINWKEIGHLVSHVFRSAPGCCTMVGPMNTEMKQRKTVVHRKRTMLTVDIRPEELDDSVRKEKTDTDKNMAIMFDILRRNRNCKLENLIINRNSFAQTVENLFALSFLIKDGRVEVAVDEDGCHLVSPRNAPSANAILSGEASYSHFIFRFDFKDWKLMLASVGVGDELMPHRRKVSHPSSTQPNLVAEEAEAAPPTTPIRKLSRNRGLVMQEQVVVEDSPESGDTAAVRAAAIRKGKRKLT